MTANRKITVHLSIRFEDMAMDSTEAGMDCVKSVMATVSDHCEAEFKQALLDAGAKDVSVGMTAF